MKKVLLVLAIVGMLVMPIIPNGRGIERKDKIWMPLHILWIGKNSKFLNATKNICNVTTLDAVPSEKVSGYSAIFIDSQLMNKISMEEKDKLDREIIDSISRGVIVVAFGKNAAFLSTAILNTGNKDWGVSIPLFNVIINAYAYIPSLNVSLQQFSSDDLDKHAFSIANDLLGWIKNVLDLTKNRENNEQKKLSAPYWQWRYEWSWYSYDSWKPKGKFNM